MEMKCKIRFMAFRTLALLGLSASLFAGEDLSSEIASCCPSQTNVEPSNAGPGSAWYQPKPKTSPSAKKTPEPSSSGAAGAATSQQPVAPPPPVDPGALLDSDWHLKLQSQGVNIAASYYVEFAANTAGGAARGVGNAASLGTALGLDFEKLINIPGLSFFSSAIFRSGVNLSARKIGNQFPVTQLYGGETIRLNELYLKESLFDGRFHIKAGRLTGGNDFLSSPFYCEFISNAICGNPISIFFNVPFLAYPFSTWGAYLDFKLIPTLLGKFAVYNNNISIVKNEYHGCNFTFNSTDGVLWMNEWVYLLNQAQADTGYKGNYKLGGYYKTGQETLFTGGSQTGNYGLYALFDQMLYRKYGPGTSQGLTMFGSFLFAPDNRNMFPYFFDIALIYKGAFNRHRDYVSLGLAHGNYSHDLRDAQRQAQASSIPGPYGTQPQTSETILELNYWWRFNKWLAITPGMQYIMNPSGRGTTPNAFVLETQISIDLIGLPNQP